MAICPYAIDLETIAQPHRLLLSLCPSCVFATCKSVDVALATSPSLALDPNKNRTKPSSSAAARARRHHQLAGSASIAIA